MPEVCIDDKNMNFYRMYCLRGGGAKLTEEISEGGVGYVVSFKIFSVPVRLLVLFCFCPSGVFQCGELARGKGLSSCVETKKELFVAGYGSARIWRDSSMG